MRCTACGADPNERDSGCHDGSWLRASHLRLLGMPYRAAHRVVFTRHGREDDSESIPIAVHAAPPTVPASKAREEYITAPGILSRALAKIRGQ